MPELKKENVRLGKDIAEFAAACSTALAETCKALKAYSFYPESHPLREKIIHGAYHSIVDLVRDGALSVTVLRNGFTVADGAAAVATTPLIAALAHELFAREVKRLALLPELSLADFTRFIALLAMDPLKVSAGGGLGQMVKSGGIVSVIVNEIDVTTVFTKKAVGATEESAVNGSPVADREPDEADSEWILPTDINEDRPEELSIDELLATMSPETDDGTYRELARKLLAKGQPLKLHREFDRLYKILVGMAEQHADQSRSAVHRDCALMVLQQLTLGEAAEHLLDHLEDKDFGPKETLCLILSRLGADMVDPVVKRLVAAAANRTSRKALGTALARIGRPAVPALHELLYADRWQVVHAAVAVLGEIGSRDAVKGLSVTIFHDDDRVRSESIRALAKIGGMEATNVLLDLLRNGDEAVGIHVITWLGSTRNHVALEPLLQLVLKGNLLRGSFAIKKAALIAIGRIGDRRALDPLVRLVNKRRWILPNRWEELKVVAVEAIGQLGGKPAQTFLEQMSATGGVVGRASSAALAAMLERKPPRDV